MKSNLVSQIICPKCGKGFELKSAKMRGKEITSGTLVCKNKHKFPVTNGIPRLVSDKAQNFVKTEDAFSAKWKKMV